MDWQKMSPDQIAAWPVEPADAGPYRTPAAPPSYPEIPPPPRTPRDAELHLTELRMHREVEEQLRSLSARVHSLHMTTAGLGISVVAFALLMLLRDYLRG